MQPQLRELADLLRNHEAETELIGQHECELSEADAHVAEQADTVANLRALLAEAERVLEQRTEARDCLKEALAAERQRFTLSQVQVFDVMGKLVDDFRASHDQNRSLTLDAPAVNDSRPAENFEGPTLSFGPSTPAGVNIAQEGRILGEVRPSSHTTAQDVGVDHQEVRSDSQPGPGLGAAAQPAPTVDPEVPSRDAKPGVLVSFLRKLGRSSEGAVGRSGNVRTADATVIPGGLGTLKKVAGGDPVFVIE